MAAGRKSSTHLGRDFRTVVFCADSRALEITAGFRTVFDSLLPCILTIRAVFGTPDHRRVRISPVVRRQRLLATTFETAIKRMADSMSTRKINEAPRGDGTGIGHEKKRVIEQFRAAIAVGANSKPESQVPISKFISVINSGIETRLWSVIIEFFNSPNGAGGDGGKIEIVPLSAARQDRIPIKAHLLCVGQDGLLLSCTRIAESASVQNIICGQTLDRRHISACALVLEVTAMNIVIVRVTVSSVISFLG